MVPLNQSGLGRRNQGFALLVVLWVVAILSAVSLTLMASTRVEARNAAAEWDRLIGQRLARSGQEFALYLRSKSLGLPTEDLSGLPIDIHTPGFRYTLRFPEGAVELFLESDTGKINPATTDGQFLQNFFTLWKGDAEAGLQVSEAIRDWSDPDAEVRPNGAEAGFYSSLGYAPRDSALGIADLPLIRGLNFDDFYPRVVTNSSALNVREGLDEFMTSIPTGTEVNPNFAPKQVLLSVPGLTVDQVQSLLEARRQGIFFRNADELRSRIAIPSNSVALRFFRFNQWTAPTLLTATRDTSGKLIHSERRVYEIVPTFNPSTAVYEFRIRLHRIQADHIPEFLRE